MCYSQVTKSDADALVINDGCFKRGFRAEQVRSEPESVILGTNRKMDVVTFPSGDKLDLKW